MKKYYTNDDIKSAVADLLRQIHNDNFRPDYIVGLNRGGLIPSVMMSHFLDCNHYTLDVRLRDGEGSGPESNCWMAEDAFGYMEDEDISGTIAHGDNAKNILIVDDINDSGATLQWIKEDWKSSCLPNHERWDNVWGKNVRTAVVCNNLGSDFEVDYSYFEVNKSEEDVWLVFSYEEWWK